MTPNAVRIAAASWRFISLSSCQQAANVAAAVAAAAAALPLGKQ